MASGAEINMICIDLKPQGRLKVCVQEFGFRGYGCLFSHIFVQSAAGRCLFYGSFPKIGYPNIDSHMLSLCIGKNILSIP